MENHPAQTSIYKVLCVLCGLCGKPKNAKRTQFPYRWRLAGFPILHYRKQTQFLRIQRPATPKMRNEPNLTSPTTRKRETNPKRIIARRRRASTYITPRFHRRGTPACPDQWPTPKKYETNPIPQGQLPKANTQKPKYAKQTQFPPVSNLKSQISPRLHPYMRNEPNYQFPPVSSLPFRISDLSRISTFGFRISPRPTPNSAKQTQSPYGHAPGAPGCPCNAKQTQFTAPAPSCRPCHTRPRPKHDPNVQNEPNLAPAQHPECAKRIQFPLTKCPTAPYFSETNPIYTATDLGKLDNMQVIRLAVIISAKT